MGTREEVGVTTTGGERAWGSIGDDRAIFSDVADSDGWREGSGGWYGRVGTTGDAFGCWEEEAKGLGSIGWV